MATATVTYTNFVNGQASDADAVDQNFSDLLAFLNQSVVHVDGTKSMTGILTLPASSPTTDNHAARKKYVDDQIAEGPASLTLTQDSSLASDTVSATGAFQEWGSGGGDIVTVTNPSRAVTIWAVLTGDAVANASGGVGTVHVSISLDNGSSYADGHDIDFYMGGLQTHAFAAQALRGGTPTGNIKVKAEIKQTGGSAGDVTWSGGNLVVLVIPA